MSLDLQCPLGFRMARAEPPKSGALNPGAYSLRCFPYYCQDKLSQADLERCYIGFAGVFSEDKVGSSITIPSHHVLCQKTLF